MVGEITEISGDLKALSHQVAVFTHPPTVVSHDLLMHQNLDRFLRQPRPQASVTLAAQIDQSDSEAVPGGTRLSGREALELPAAAGLAGVAQAVMEAILAVLPELEHLGDQAEATPGIGQRQLGALV